jgi:ATP-dependent protease HslVU (ClpYQ) peptidase subunit
MTTIVGYQGEDFAVISVDTRISSTDEKGSVYQISSLAPGSAKITQNGNYLLGAAGDMRAINILQHIFQPPSPAPSLKGKRLDKFMTQKFIPALIDCFDNNGYSPPERDSSEHRSEHGSTVLAVINATIYIIENDYAWMSEASGLYATGSGSSYALGAMQAITGGKKTLTLQQAKKACMKALSVAAKYDPATGAPFHTFVQGTEKPVARTTKK